MHFIKLLIPLLLFLGCCVTTGLFAQTGSFMKPNQHAYYYILTPTGFAAPPGQSMFQNGAIALNQYQKTTPRGNSWGIGLIPTLLFGESYMPMWVFGHKRIPLGGRKQSPRSVLNLGGFFVSVPETNDRGSIGTNDVSFFYANSTFGTPEKNFAIGGFAAPTGFGQGKCPWGVSLHGLVRLGRKSCLVTENYAIYNQGKWRPLSVSGWRFWKRRLALDCMLGITKVPWDDNQEIRSFFVPIPWVAVHYNRHRGQTNQP